jgi:hypothetical protein
VSADTSPPLGALVALSQAGIPFCVVGVTGINFYASDASQVVRTEDVDVLLAPRVEALRGALEALGSAGFSFRAGGEPFVDVSDDAVLWRVLERGGTITAEDAAGARLDLMLSARGLSFDDLLRDAAIFRVGDVEVRVGRLEKLLRAKELVGRPKDVEFLRLYAARLREQAGEG